MVYAIRNHDDWGVISAPNIVEAARFLVEDVDDEEIREELGDTVPEVMQHLYEAPESMK